MITSVFKKSTPINYSLMLILILASFFIIQFQDTKWLNSLLEIGKKAVIFSLILGSFFLVNFISKKNGLTRDSGYTMLFFFLFLLFSPTILNNFTLIAANFFVLLALRRLVSLQTLKAPKEKIFDASLWIFVASLFQFWCVLFLFVVYVSIIFHVSRDYRNWLIPFVALFTTAVIFVFYGLLIDKSAILIYLNNITTNFQLDYFTNTYQNLALSMFAVFAVFFVIPMIFSLTNRPLNLQASYKKMLFTFFIGLIIYFISSNKSNDLLLFTFFPMAVFATNTIEFSQNKVQKEIILALAIILGLVAFFIQL